MSKWASRPFDWLNRSEFWKNYRWASDLNIRKFQSKIPSKMAPVFFSKSDDFGTKSNRKEDFKMLQTQKEGYQTIYMPSPANFAKDDKDSLHGTWKNTSGISEKHEGKTIFIWISWIIQMIFSIRKFPKTSMVIFANFLSQFGQGLHGFPIDLENIPAKFQISEKNGWKKEWPSCCFRLWRKKGFWPLK